MVARRYEQLFLEMAAAIRAAQFADEADARTFGFWPPALLAPELVADPESSGTGFFVAGLAWGVHTGRLAAAEYLPAAQSGWRALLRAQQPDGRVGWVQQIGSQPEAVRQEDTQLYGAGAFLQAAARMLQLVEAPPGAAAPQPASAEGARPAAAPLIASETSPAQGLAPGQSQSPGAESAAPVPNGSAPLRSAWMVGVATCVAVLLGAA